MANSVADNGKKFVAAFEDRKYPFFSTQFHPEKEQWEKRMNRYVNLDRSKSAVDVASGFIIELAELSRIERNYEIGELDAKAAAYKAFEFMMFPYLMNGFESIYLIAPMSDCGDQCHKIVNSPKRQDEMYEIWKKLRDTDIDIDGIPMSDFPGRL